MNFDRLIKLIREEKVSLFIGAGFSIEADAPSVKELCNAILGELDKEQQEEHKDDDLSALSDFYVENICLGSRNELITLLKEKFEFEPKCMTDHSMMAGIPHFHNIYTTNYDTLLESSYPQDEVNVIRNDKDCAFFDPKRTNVFKIHGDFNDPDSVIITKTDYNKFQKKPPFPQLWNMVTSEFVKTHILFIGYSLTDDNIVDIITGISKQIGRNQKPMFLIAPHIPQSRKRQLRKLKIQYYEAYASEFFTVLMDELKEHISDDFRHHKISTETYDRFCKSNHFTPVVSLSKEGENQILSYKPLPGELLTEQVQFTIKPLSEDPFNGFDFERFGKKGINQEMPDLPSILFTGEDLLKCKHSVNGVLINSEIKSLMLTPSVTELTLTISIPSESFIERANCRAFKLNEHKRRLVLDCHIYLMEITLDFSDIDTKGYGIQFYFESKDSYSDNNEALKWIKLIKAFFAKEDLIIKELSSLPINLSDSKKQPSGNPFVKHERYYQNIKAIELKTGNKFEKYFQYSDEAYNISNIVLSYLNHTVINYQLKDEQVSFGADIIPSKAFLQEVEDGSNVAIVHCETTNSQYELNGNVFVIPYTHKIYNNCKVKEMKKLSNDGVHIDFCYQGRSYQVLFSDKPMDDEFPEMRTLEAYSKN